MFSFKSVYFVIFNLILCQIGAEISDKRLCIDQKCSEVIAFGKTLLKYSSPEDNILSFLPNENVKIFSYGAGKRSELIGVKLRGKRGYINKSHIRETRLVKRPQLIVNTELVQNTVEVPLESAASEIKADPTQQSFEIVDGTKIPLDLTELSSETSIPDYVDKENNILSTQSLGSVPDNFNTNQPASAPIVNTLENKIEGSKEEGQADDDDDDEGTDEDGDDEDADSGGDDSDETDVKKPTSESDSIAASSNNVLLGSNVEETFHNATDEDVNTNAEIVHEQIAEKQSQVENEVTNESNMQVDQNTELNNLGKLENLTATESTETTNPDVSENNANPKEEFSENIQEKFDLLEISVNHTESNISSAENIEQQLDTLNLKVDESMPVLNESAIPVEPTADEASINVQSVQGKTGSIFVSAENDPLNSAEGIINDLDEVPGDSKESLSPKVDTSLPVTTTEIPIEIEILPPLETNSVTPNPLEAKSEEHSFSENSIPLKYDLPNNLMPEFKDPEENAELVSGGILSVLDNGDDRNDEAKLDSAEDNKPPPEEPYNISPESDENANTVGQNDEANENSIEELDAEFTAEIEKDLQSESAGSFLSGIMSFFGFSSETETDKTTTEIEDLPTESFVDDTLDISHKGPEVSENPTAHNPWYSDIVTAQIEENLEVCDSKSEKCPLIVKQGFCGKEDEDCPDRQKEYVPHEQTSRNVGFEDFEEIFIQTFSSDMFLYLTTTSLSVLVLIFVWILVDKCRREGPLIARINKLEQQLLATSKENEMLQEKTTLFAEEKTQLVVETVPNEVVDELNEKLTKLIQEKLALEEQIQALEKELDTSTEVGIELNKMISEMLNSTDGSEILKENVEQMQKKLLEQQDTINSLNQTSNLRETENYELGLEVEISSKKVATLQSEVDKMVEKILKIEEERDQQQKTLENEIAVYQNKCKEALIQEHVLKNEIIALKQKVAELQRIADTKIKEYGTLKDNIKTLKTVKNDKNALKSFLDVSEVKAQLEQKISENLKYSEELSQEREINLSYNTQIQTLSQEVKELKEKYEKADKEKVETNTKLEVLNNYFKEKEDQMQKEISKYESLWAVKEGEATSTTERIRYMQEELQNYKAQNEGLKQEIINQEVELKSQISMLEKKSHENWVANRQTERKLEEARQEAALLRNRLTMRERAIAEGPNQIRMQSPLHQNGELPISPPPLNPTQSPPPLYNPRDHMTKSPPIPGLPPPPFLPPPLGATPFIPPPPLDGMMHPPLGEIGGMPPFISGLHTGMFPGDHRPPPLGRMSSPPPVGGRYTPESTVYSEYDRYDRRSPSPPYDSEYGASPPPIRGYSPYDDRDRDRLRDDRREYKRPQPRSNGRNSKGLHSSGSENDSLGKMNKKPHRKV